MIIGAIILLLIGGIILLANKKTEDKEIIPKDVLREKLVSWASEMNQNNNHDKCVERENNQCFISLTSLKENYGYDISLFIDKRANCSVETSGIYFDTRDESDSPFGIYLSGCTYLETEATNK